MGFMDKLMAKAEKVLAEKLQQAQAQQQQQQQGYGAPQVYQQQPGQYYTPPATPRPFDPQQFTGEPPRVGTPPPGSMPDYLAPTTYSPNPQGPQSGRKKAVLVRFGVAWLGLLRLLGPHRRCFHGW